MAEMKILKRPLDKITVSFAASIVLHLIVILIISFKAEKDKAAFDLVKLPNAIALNMNGSGGNGKAFKQALKPTTSVGSGPNVSTAQATPSMESVGTGEGGSKNGVAGGSGDVEAAYLTAKQKYLIEFRGLIENRKEYPLMARRRGIEGIVVIGVTIRKNGEVVEHKIVQASGHDILDQAALNLVKKINSFKAFPAELGNDDIDLKFPIAFKLNS
jgi:TonB family protein